jgi:hypothetical protein
LHVQVGCGLAQFEVLVEPTGKSAAPHLIPGFDQHFAGTRVVLPTGRPSSERGEASWQSPTDLTASPELGKILNLHFRDAAE